MQKGFVGRGKVQAAFDGDRVLVRIDAATTQTRKIKEMVRTFFRKEVAFSRPHFGPFEVKIWLAERGERGRQLDVDNVAKACLDGLNGAVWRDDRQVVRLTIEKFQSDRAQIALIAAPSNAPPEERDFDLALFEL